MAIKQLVLLWGIPALILAMAIIIGDVALRQPQSTSPTATEIFYLRSECAHLVRTYDENYQENPAQMTSFRSHYNPKTNRCYLEAVSHASFLKKLPDNYYTRTILDAQTQQLLAAAQVNGKLIFGTINDPNYHPIHYPPNQIDKAYSYQTATDYMDKIMEDGD